MDGEEVDRVPAETPEIGGREQPLLGGGEQPVFGGRAQPPSAKLRETVLLAAGTCLLLSVTVLVWSWDWLHDRVPMTLMFFLGALIVPLSLLLLRLAIEGVQHLFGGRDSGGKGVGRAARARFHAGRWWVVGAAVVGMACSLFMSEDMLGSLYMTFLFGILGYFTVAPLLLLLVIGFKVQHAVPDALANVRAAFVSQGLILIIVFGAALLPRACIYQRMKQRDAENTMTWCESLVPRLDAWKEGHGAFPKSLIEFDDEGVLPHLIHHDVEYSSRDPEHFLFDVPDPAAWLEAAGWRFESESRQWERYD